MLRGEPDANGAVSFRFALRFDPKRAEGVSLPGWTSVVRRPSITARGLVCTVQYCVNIKEMRAALSDPHCEVTRATKRALIDVINHQFTDTDRIRVQWQQPHRSVLQRVLPMPQPRSISVQLYDYQLRALSWMKTLEDGAMRKKYRFQTLLKAPFNFGCYVPAQPGDFGSDFECVWETDKYQHKDSLSTRGGILADEMGLGKTLEMLSLVLANPRTVDDQCGMYEPLERPAMLYEVKATLVICPSHIVGQWAGEVARHCPQLVCVTIAGPEEHKEVSYSEVEKADIVIVSHQLLSASKYVKSCGNVNTLQRRMANATKVPKKHQRDATSPVLELFGFHRIILDEAHEILAKAAGSKYKANAQKMFDKFYSNFRWFVSGTPIPFGRASLVGAMNFLQVTLESGISFPETEPRTPQLFEQVVFSAMKSCLFWRTSKASVESTLRIPPLVEDVRLIQLSKAERVLYNIAEHLGNKQMMRETCSFPTQATYVLERSDEIPSSPYHALRMLRARFLAELTSERRELKSANAERAILADKIEEMTREMTRATPAELPSLERAMRKVEAKDVAMAAAAEKREQRIVELVSVLTLADAKLQVTPARQRTVAERFGTKIGEIVAYLDRVQKDEPGAKVIVFSKFERLLSVIERHAGASERFASCKGTAKQRVAALESFKNGRAQVLLLSLKNAASGTHLTVATHVMLLDPVSGSKSDAQATDSQAIARAHRLGQEKQVTVVRFIVMHTIDQYDYEDAYDTIVS
eukprot:TRINITY_DN4167_c0_g1_i1.p1 TRINITY_DN4167_c0_g1~~TRINITY_DN4167_c0_g1_i1.p1  ORF type:complete len:754 (+),score=232.42 TRINITY_DN4167_c0_g1_i1:2-2263(+)